MDVLDLTMADGLAVPTAGKFDYVISGLTVRSEVEIPSAIASSAFEDAPQVTIRSAALPEHLTNPLRARGLIEADEESLLFQVPRVARFLVHGGVEILFDAEPGHDPGDVTLYLLGTCFAALLQQRGCLVLHASAVSVGGRAMLFCGQSGAGKSTIAAMLCERGYPLLNDDVCCLWPEPDGGFSVTPDGRMLKLWAQSVDQLELAERRGPSVRKDTAKFYLAPALTEQASQRVGGVYMLQAADEVSLERLSVVDGMMELKRNSYRQALIWAMGLEPAYFKATAELLNEASLDRLKRPMDFACADAVVGLLEAGWNAVEG